MGLAVLGLSGCVTDEITSPLRFDREVVGDLAEDTQPVADKLPYRVTVLRLLDRRPAEERHYEARADRLDHGGFAWHYTRDGSFEDPDGEGADLVSLEVTRCLRDVLANSEVFQGVSSQIPPYRVLDDRYLEGLSASKVDAVLVGSIDSYYGFKWRSLVPDGVAMGFFITDTALTAAFGAFGTGPAAGIAILQYPLSVYVLTPAVATLVELFEAPFPRAVAGRTSLRLALVSTQDREILWEGTAYSDFAHREWNLSGQEVFARRSLEQALSNLVDRLGREARK